VAFVLGATRATAEAILQPPGPGVAPPAITALGCPVRDQIDAAAFELLRHVLGADVNLRVASAEMLSSEVMALAAETRPTVICVGTVAPGGAAHARGVVKRLHARCPEATIVLAQWGAPEVLAGRAMTAAPGEAAVIVTALAQVREQILALGRLARTPAKSASAA